MGLGMEINIILAYAIGLILLYIVGWLLLVPIKLIGRLIWNGILGGVLLFFVNIIGGFFDFYIVINPISALVAGFLGIPGVILLIILNAL
ncbi:pro-sigmaK processing inhibitor BofA [Alkaliphilus pronyensis]|uniref:Pro-sigmaK processing inhibitor BofA n=1 Tax=Alkaliphilus pronyensis TaxID=1482732 RepID=A0A6I0EYH9_9FIRM|nr:pro-sigmaK processing inhibitor BofA family protein [Alkaliphilus pronyensis]KAB3530305.1 pro-sigmaK processing inhibitor BofA [Alkaliphilus pronyensis]